MPIGPPAVIAYNWTGFYAGATVGGIGANFDPRTSTGPADYLNLVEAVSVTSSGTQTINPRSFTGGFEAGYNWQWSRFLVGFEVDLSVFRLAGTAISNAPYPDAPFTYAVTTSINSNWLFTALPRVGFVANEWLFYVTGGLALTSLNATFLFGDTNGAAENGTFATTKVGSALGGGIEVGLWDGWTVKGEYLYVDFGQTSVVMAGFQIDRAMNIQALPASRLLNCERQATTTPSSCGTG